MLKRIDDEALIRKRLAELSNMEPGMAVRIIEEDSDHKDERLGDLPKPYHIITLIIKNRG
jgi:hypothetical protein